MNRMIRVSLLAAALAAPVSLSAQAAPPAGHGRHAGEARGVQGARRGPVAALLEHRAELSLTAEQVARLEGIDARLQEKNRPLMEKLRSARPAQGQNPREMTPEQRQALRKSMRDQRPEMEQMRENARAALQEAQAVLTDAQRQKAREVARGRRGRG